MDTPLLLLLLAGTGLPPKRARREWMRALMEEAAVAVSFGNGGLLLVESKKNR